MTLTFIIPSLLDNWLQINACEWPYFVLLLKLCNQDTSSNLSDVNNIPVCLFLFMFTRLFICLIFSCPYQWRFNTSKLFTFSEYQKFPKKCVLYINNFRWFCWWLEHSDMPMIVSWLAMTNIFSSWRQVYSGLCFKCYYGDSHWNSLYYYIEWFTS